MICQPCRKGAEAATDGLESIAQGFHLECPGGTWCDCQHKLPSEARMRGPSDGNR